MGKTHFHHRKKWYPKFAYQTGRGVSDQLILFKTFEYISSELGRGISEEEDTLMRFSKEKSLNLIF